MRPYRLRVLEQAYDDLASLAAIIELDSEAMADRFLERAFTSFDNVLLYPEALAVVFPEIDAYARVRRGLIHKQPNHQFYFYIEDREVVVFRVLDARRDDLRWLARLP